MKTKDKQAPARQGVKILEQLRNGDFKQYQGLSKRWYYGFYTIDFNANTFTTKYGGTIAVYKLDRLPTKSKYLKDLKEL